MPTQQIQQIQQPRHTQQTQDPAPPAARPQAPLRRLTAADLRAAAGGATMAEYAIMVAIVSLPSPR